MNTKIENNVDEVRAMTTYYGIEKYNILMDDMYDGHRNIIINDDGRLDSCVLNDDLKYSMEEHKICKSHFDDINTFLKHMNCLHGWFIIEKEIIHDRDKNEQIQCVPLCPDLREIIKDYLI